MNNASNRCLHHHIFYFAVLEAILEYSGFTILRKLEVFYNPCIMAKKKG